MQRSQTRARFFGRWMFLLALAACSSPVAARSPEDPVKEGELLFAKTFSPGRTQSGGGDGLGPLFNHVSCAACHRQGAIGGGGGIEFNVFLITAELPSAQPDGRLLFRSLTSLHPGFVSKEGNLVPTIILHRFGPGEQYFELKTSLGGHHVPIDLSDAERTALQEQLARHPTSSVERMNRIRLVRSQRNSTALFGAGLIDKVSDDLLYEVARRQDADGIVSGRAPPIGPDKVGRFGWRGQKEHLHDFVLGACANELGLEVPGNSQPINPLMPRHRSRGLDLTKEQCESLTAYVASLPAPKQLPLRQVGPHGDRQRGKELFASIGCAHCHLEQLGSLQGIYSDLLLHDMGQGLADPAPAEPTLTFLRQMTREEAAMRPEPPRFTPPRGYFGGSSSQFVALNTSRSQTVEIDDPKTGGRKVFRAEPSNLQAEWRTPPLWGVADSAPYLHDGRAANLVDAVDLHGGEAEFSVKRFRELDLEDRVRLIAFLRSLRAP